jgi:hypothetical protein
VNRRAIALVVVCVGVAISFRVVQGMFDRADHSKAELTVRTLTGPGGPTLEDVLARKDPGARTDAAWSSEILSGCRGFVRVRCRLASAGGEYVFDVDLVRRAVHPGNEAGKVALSELGGPAAPRP